MRFHLAAIMDGNGRWAAARGLPRLAGHYRGVETLRRVVEAAPGLGITDLTVYAFSSDNWKRPAEEVGGLMGLFSDYLEREVERCAREGVRLGVIGRRDRLPVALVRDIEEAERFTQDARRLTLRIAMDYSSRASILDARRGVGLDTGVPDVDLMIRTAGEQRLSDFLLWESAYAEFWFTAKTWPEFSVEDLREAVAAYSRRVRKFGGLAYSDGLAMDSGRGAGVAAVEDAGIDTVVSR